MPEFLAFPPHLTTEVGGGRAVLQHGADVLAASATFAFPVGEDDQPVRPEDRRRAGDVTEFPCGLAAVLGLPDERRRNEHVECRSAHCRYTGLYLIDPRSPRKRVLNRPWRRDGFTHLSTGVSDVNCSRATRRHRRAGRCHDTFPHGGPGGTDLYITLPLVVNAHREKAGDGARMQVRTGSVVVSRDLAMVTTWVQIPASASFSDDVDDTAAASSSSVTAGPAGSTTRPGRRRLRGRARRGARGRPGSPPRRPTRSRRYPRPSPSRPGTAS